jgi:hypothetical protein
VPARSDPGTEADLGLDTEAGADVARDLLAAARGLAEQVLAPAAAECDTGSVPASHVRALADAGLLGLTADSVSTAVAREVLEVLAGACAATWFVALQHYGTAARVQQAVGVGRSTLTVGVRVWDAAELSAALLGGSVVGGTAMAHVRRPDRPVRATRVAGGWRVEGRVAWYTGWGLNDVMVLAAVADDGSVVSGLVPAVASAALVPGPFQRPLAMGGTRTVTLDLSGLVVVDDAVLGVVSAADFAAGDARQTANCNPGVFGVSGAALSGLRPAGGAAADLASSLEDERVELRTRAWALIDDVPADELLDERLALRAAAGELAFRAATAEIAAAGGRGLAPGHCAQRHAREALFLLTQAQTTALRSAQLTHLRATGSS